MTIEDDVALFDMGLDSLMTTEIRQILGRRFDVQLTVPEVQNLNIKKLKQLLS